MDVVRFVNKYLLLVVVLHIKIHKQYTYSNRARSPLE